VEFEDRTGDRPGNAAFILGHAHSSEVISVVFGVKGSTIWLHILDDRMKVCLVSLGGQNMSVRSHKLGGKLRTPWTIGLASRPRCLTIIVVKCVDDGDWPFWIVM
jgi:hypothetical protein